MTGRSQRIEVITSGERRRRWSVEQKRAIVLASLEAGARPAEVARLHDINTSLLYTWRRQMVDGRLGEEPRALPGFARVAVYEAGSPAPVSRSCQSPSSDPASLIEIVLPSGILVRVGAAVESAALRRVLGVLVRR